MTYRKIKRPFPPPPAAHPVVHAPPSAVPPARRPAAAALASAHRPLALQAEGRGRAAGGGQVACAAPAMGVSIPMEATPLQHAEKHLQQALLLQPDYASAGLLLGLVYWRQATQPQRQQRATLERHTVRRSVPPSLLIQRRQQLLRTPR